MPEHNELTGSSLHEPKGAAAASSGQVYVADGNGSGSFQTLSAGATPPIIKYKDADNTPVNNSTTLVDDDDLANFSLAASTTYIVEGDVYVNSADGSTDIDCAFSLDSGSLTDSYLRYSSFHVDGDNNEIKAGAITDEKTVTSLSGTTQVLVRLTGYVVVDAASVLSFQFAQNTAVATDSETKQGSWIKFTPIES